MQLRTERDRVAHLLRRFGLGASEAELDFYAQGGLKGAIDKLLSPDQIEEAPMPEPDALAGKKGAIKPQTVRAWWIARLLTTRRPLLEKMTVFWHDHFATSVQKVDNAQLMYGQNQILRENALGKFSELLSEVSKDPAMMFWLDNELNVKGKPNENFAREVMELFTLGFGNYSEKDIQEAARAFTGWNYTQRRGKKAAANPNSIKGGKPTFRFNEEEHDGGTKTILGKSGTFDGDDVLGILTANPQCARFITKKIWDFFVYPNADAATIERHAAAFRNSGLDIKVLLRSIMESDEFYSDRSARKVYKNPVDFTITTLRQIGAVPELTLDDEGQLKPGGGRPIQVAVLATKAMGMELLAPPDVSGWDGGPNWISTATMVERIRWADRIFGVYSRVEGGGKGKVQTLGFGAAKLFDNGDPLAVARKMCSLFDADLPEVKVAQIADAVRKAAGGDVTASTAGEAADAACRLIFGSPEFQFC